jgi:hypothetical protein
MRVIRTEMYFDEEEIVGFEPGRRYRPPIDPEGEENPGLAFAWFRSDFPGPFDFKNYKWFEGFEIQTGDVGQALDLLLRGGGNRELRRWRGEGEIRNQEVVDFIFNQDIILERSPPTAIPFKDLLKKSNGPLWIGAAMGYSLAGDHPALLFVTVPGGIIVVSSALGVAEAIAGGLNKRIKRLFDGK